MDGIEEVLAGEGCAREGAAAGGGGRGACGRLGRALGHLVLGEVAVERAVARWKRAGGQEGVGRKGLAFVAAVASLRPDEW